MTERFSKRWVLYSLLASWILLVGFRATPVWAQLNVEPEEIKDIGVNEHLDQSIPLDAVFTTAEGRTVRFGDLFKSHKPVILNLAYFSCPMLCGLIWQGMSDALKSMPLNVSADYDIITLSIDPAETPTLAKIKKQNMLKEYGRPGADRGWHYLTGKETEIKKITEAVGFQYKWNESQKQFAHPAVLVILMPDGKISRYLYGIQFDPQTLRLSLVEASQGKIGSTLDQVILTCFHYDPSKNRYAPVAMGIMRLGGALTVFALGIFLGFYWLLEFRKKKPQTIEGMSS